MEMFRASKFPFSNVQFSSLQVSWRFSNVRWFLFLFPLFRLSYFRMHDAWNIGDASFELSYSILSILRCSGFRIYDCRIYIKPNSRLTTFDLGVFGCSTVDVFTFEFPSVFLVYVEFRFYLSRFIWRFSTFAAISCIRVLMFWGSSCQLFSLIFSNSSLLNFRIFRVLNYLFKPPC